MIEYLLNVLHDFCLRIRSHDSLKGSKMNVCDHLLILTGCLRGQLLDSEAYRVFCYVIK